MCFIGELSNVFNSRAFDHISTVQAVAPGQFITATATTTDPAGNTSEFSQCVEVEAAGSLGFSATSYTVNESAGVAPITITRTGGSAGQVRVITAPSDGSATAGQDYTAFSLVLSFGEGITSRTLNVPILDDTLAEGNETINLTLIPLGLNAVGSPSTAVLTIVDNDAGPTGPALQFDAFEYSATEGCAAATLTVLRSGDTSGETTVSYTTSNGTASDRTDYTTSMGKLRFAAGDTAKSVSILITEDSHIEGTETVMVTLSDPVGANLITPSAVTLQIFDDSSEPSTNSIDDATTFVCQQYHDFLNREPDAGGLGFWTNEITSCGTNAQCIDIKRTNVSAAFFLSIEFQETGYLVHRMYKAAYGDTTSPNVPIPVPIIRLNEFLPDAQRIGQGVQVGIGDWQTQLENNKNGYAMEFVARPRFQNAYPLTMTPAQFVDKLNLNAGGVLTPAERDQLIAELAAATDVTQGRASVTRKVAEDADLRQRETNRAFVLMQYYGYLRRNPDDPQDTDFRGWEFWLNKLNQFNGNFVQAEMVKAFILSIEYRGRFGN